MSVVEGSVAREIFCSDVFELRRQRSERIFAPLVSD